MKEPITIKPTCAAAHLFPSFNSVARSLDHRQPCSRRSTNISSGSQWFYPIQSSPCFSNPPIGGSTKFAQQEICMRTTLTSFRLSLRLFRSFLNYPSYANTMPLIMQNSQIETEIIIIVNVYYDVML